MTRSPEANQLLEFLRSISGKQTLAGQHCVPLVGSTRLGAVFKITGKYPALFGQDFGFSAPGDWDGINFRQQIVDESIRRHAEGFVITLMWHAVNPLDDEPVDFQSSICRKLDDARWTELVTPGTHLNDRWKSQVDVIAWHLRQLKHAGVPVLWRPYHEMNGEWFWWGKKSGPDGYAKLYRILHERLTRFHGLDNLIWVYNCNEVSPNVNPYTEHYPGDDVMDVLATDVYRLGFDQNDYESLFKLAGDRPVAVGECGVNPSPEILEKQPRWTWFMQWGDPSSAMRDPSAMRALYEHPRVLTLDRLPWVKLKSPRVHYPILR